MRAAISVRERGERIDYTFADLMRYHGGGSPGGVAHAFKVMERAFALLDQSTPAGAWVRIHSRSGASATRA